jgi:hypothetical protein
MIRVVCSSRIRMLTFSHPGSRGQKGTQSRIRIRITASKVSLILAYQENAPSCLFCEVPYLQIKVM